MLAMIQISSEKAGSSNCRPGPILRVVDHRDIKPANILVNTQGQPYIADFGVAHLPASNLTRTGVAIGTPNYMSPEQIAGKSFDHRSDVFSLGVLVHELLTGSQAFPGDNITTVMHKVLNSKPELLDRLPGAIGQVLTTALAKDPDARFQNCRNLITSLQGIAMPAEGTQLQASAGAAGSLSVPPAPAASQRLILFLVGTLLVLLLIMFGVLWTWSGGSEGRRRPGGGEYGLSRRSGYSSRAGRRQ